MRDGGALNRKQSKWLDGYETAVSRLAAKKAKASRKSSRKRAKKDSRDIAEALQRALMDWRGMSGPTRSRWLRRPEGPTDRGVAIAGQKKYAPVPVTSPGERDDGPRGSYAAGDPPKLPSFGGRKVAIRVEIQGQDGRQWVSAKALSPDSDTYEDDLEVAIDDIEDRYAATAVYGWSVYVR